MRRRFALNSVVLTGAASLVFYLAVRGRCLCPVCHDGDPMNAVRGRLGTTTGPIATSVIDAGDGFSEVISGDAV